MTTVNDKNAELTIATSSKKTSGEPLIQEGVYTLLNEALHIRADDVKVVKGVTLIVALTAANGCAIGMSCNTCVI